MVGFSLSTFSSLTLFIYLSFACLQFILRGSWGYLIGLKSLFSQNFGELSHMELKGYELRFSMSTERKFSLLDICGTSAVDPAAG